MEQFQKTIVESMLNKMLDSIYEGAKTVAIKTWEAFKADFQLGFSTYLKNAYEKYSKIKTVIYRTEPQPLLGDKGFYEKPFLRKAGKGNIDKFLLEGLDSIISLRTNYIMIEGDGGIGKSTLMKALFLSALEDKGYIPVFVELKEINSINNDYELTELFFDKLYTMGSSIEQSLMDRTLSHSTYVFMLDGYDEILSDKRSAFRDKLEKFIDMYPDNMYIISSRPFSSFIELSRFTILSVCPFTKEQAISQIRKTKIDNDVRKSFMQALDNELYDAHRDFASNPLLLNIMLLTYDNYGNIPDNLHNFFAEAFDTMLQKHDATKGIFKRELRSNLSNDRFKDIFAEFCFYTYCIGITVFSRREIVEILCRIDKTLNIDGYLYDLQNALCVIILDGTKYIFSHRSFQEYFSAYYLEKQSDDIMGKYGTSLIKNNPDLLITDNVFKMLSGMSKKRFERNIVLSVFREIENGMGNNDPFQYYLQLLCGKLVVMNTQSNPEKDPDIDLIFDVYGYEDDLREKLLKTIMNPKCYYFFNWGNTINNDKREKDYFISICIKLCNEDYADFYFHVTYDFLCSNSNAMLAFLKTYYGQVLNRIIDYRQEIQDRNKKTDDLMSQIAVLRD